MYNRMAGCNAIVRANHVPIDTTWRFWQMHCSDVSGSMWANLSSFLLQAIGYGIGC
jgi:hypothetical protein